MNSTAGRFSVLLTLPTHHDDFHDDPVRDSMGPRQKDPDQRRYLYIFVDGISDHGSTIAKLVHVRI